MSESEKTLPDGSGNFFGFTGSADGFVKISSSESQVSTGTGFFFFRGVFIGASSPDTNFSENSTASNESKISSVKCSISV